MDHATRLRVQTIYSVKGFTYVKTTSEADDICNISQKKIMARNYGHACVLKAKL